MMEHWSGVRKPRPRFVCRCYRLIGPAVIVAIGAGALSRLLLIMAGPSDADAHEEVVAVKQQLVSGHPITVIVPLPKPLSVDQAQLQSLPVELVIEGVKTISGQSTGFRVFVNKSNANADTPITDIHYAASVAFFPSGTSGQVSSYVVELRDTLKALAATGKLAKSDRLAITFVAIPAEGAAKEIPVRIDIESVKIRLGRS
jgi:hypothetical protein